MPSRRVLANAIRALSMDAVEKAKSGHPGAPMGMADIAEVLWNDHLRHNPANPSWPDRDRFVMSNGHGSMLIYSLLHLSGYDLGIADLQQFRQLHSRTPGHPEYGMTPGVETTTGPLGQGLANAVGMALAERVLGETFNRPEHTIVDHHSYVFLGDGCLMEGISHEACSLAGVLGLGKLICFYDDNGISIDGAVDGWFRDDTPKRFEAYGWQVLPTVDGHDPAAVNRAIQAARGDADRPTLICCRTVIAQGSPNMAGTHDAHGAPLGDAEIAATRENIDWPHEPFEVPDAVRAGWDARERGAAAEADWQGRFRAYAAAHPELAAEFRRRTAGELPAQFSDVIRDYLRDAQSRAATIATRKASQNVLNAIAPGVPELFGGSADLTGSNNTNWSGSVAWGTEGKVANYIHYGVREFGMSAVMNGIAVHGGLIPYGGTFLVFSDYARNAVRMSALMGIRVIYVYSHDSIGLGEDGPTHQPIEHAASLRLIPDLSLWRPCDEVETTAAWSAAVERRDGPTCLLLTRQNLETAERSATALSEVRRGGYVLRDCQGTPEAIVLATGSEVMPASNAVAILAAEGRRIRLVSMPSVDTFEAQDPAYREAVLPSAVSVRLVVEAGVSAGWQKYAGSRGRVFGLDRFGESAPGGQLMETFGFTGEAVAEALRTLL
jgi:transketolase